MKITPNQTWYWRHRDSAQCSCCLEPVVLCPPRWRPGAHRVPEQDVHAFPWRGTAPVGPPTQATEWGSESHSLLTWWTSVVGGAHGSLREETHPANSSRCSRGFLYKYRHVHTFLFFSQQSNTEHERMRCAEGTGRLGGDPASAPADLLPGLFHTTTVLEYI